MSWFLAYLLRPVALLLFFALVVIPLEMLIIHFIPEGRFKQLLTKRRGFGATAKQ